MRKKTHLSISLAVVLVLVGFIAVGSSAIVVHADQSTPIVHTTTTPDGQAVMITLPENYSGSVTTTYDGHQFNTVSTPLTQQQKDQIDADIAKQQQYFAQLFTDQQKMMQDMLQSMQFNFN